MRENSRNFGRQSSTMHWHNGCTCHGTPTMQECIDEAIKNGWVGRVLMKTDTIANGVEVKCFSLIASSFEHHAKYGTYVAVVELTARTL